MTDEGFRTENLKVLEEQISSENDPLKIDPKGDFGSYRLVRLGVETEKTGVHLHNMIGRAAEIYVSGLKKIILPLFMNPPATVADMGCGIGIIPYLIKKAIPSAAVDGFEISRDAIAVARERFKEINFICTAIEPSTNLAKSYDIIHAREFYPFTRTDDSNIHRSYLEMFGRHLNENGIIVINFIATEQSIWVSLQEHIKNCSSIGLALVSFNALPARKIGRFVPYQPLAIFFTKLIKRVVKRPMSYVLVFRKT